MATKTYCDRCSVELKERPTDFQVCAKIECFSKEQDSDEFNDALEFQRLDLCAGCVIVIGKLCKEFVNTITTAVCK